MTPAAGGEDVVTGIPPVRPDAGPQRLGTASAANAAVVLQDVTFHYGPGVAGITDLSMEIGAGELVVCIGPSGCGKTTLLRVIAGFLAPEKGRILLGGVEATRTSVRERECGIVFQSYALFPHMRVWENVAYPLRVRGMSVGERSRRAMEMLELVGLAELGDRLPAQLSGGQQQRVALARALVFGPRALLLDEPLSALDAATRVAMRDEVRRIQRSQDIATLLITHDQDEALSLADRVLVLKDGRLVQAAPPRTVYERPADAFVATFVGRANLLPGTTAGPDSVDTAIGTLITSPHGRPTGDNVMLLVRPERVELVGEVDDHNVFPVSVRTDRYFGAIRQLDLAVGDCLLKMDTPVRGDVRHVRVPPEAIQFLPHR